MLSSREKFLNQSMRTQPQLLQSNKQLFVQSESALADLRVTDHTQLLCHFVGELLSCLRPSVFRTNLCGLQTKTFVPVLSGGASPWDNMPSTGS